MDFEEEIEGEEGEGTLLLLLVAIPLQCVEVAIDFEVELLVATLVFDWYHYWDHLVCLLLYQFHFPTHLFVFFVGLPESPSPPPPPPPPPLPGSPPPAIPRFLCFFFFVVYS